MQHRRQLRVAANQQGPQTHRGTDLMAADGHGGGRRIGEAHRHCPKGLYGISVERHLVLGAQPGELSDGLDGADLTVGPHHGRQRDGLRFRLQQRFECVDVDPALGVDVDHDQFSALVGLQPFGGVQHGMVLNPRQQHPASSWVFGPALPPEAFDRQVVRLCAARGEDHLGGMGAHCRGQLLTGRVHRQPGAPSRAVQR